MLDIQCEEDLAKALAFADEIKMLDQLEQQLKYLAEYANTDPDNHRSVCTLRTDFAPHSFRFFMRLRERDYVVTRYRCNVCGYDLEQEGSADGAGCFTFDGEGARCKGIFQATDDVRQVHQKESAWFDGALIFHGAHDRGGDGGMPTLSVNTSGENGWVIHT